MRVTDGNLAWTEEEMELIAQHYPTGGALACARFMPSRSLGQIRSKAGREGIKYCKVVLAGWETASKPGAPARYQSTWEPLKPLQRLPVRPGSLDFRDLPSAK